MDILKIIFFAIFINNVVLSQFLGIRPIHSELNNFSSSIRMSGIMTFVLILANILIYFIQKYILIPIQIQFLQTLLFIIVIIIVSKIFEIAIKKISFKYFQKHTNYFSMIATNSIVLGVCLLTYNSDLSFNLLQSIIYTLSAAAGYTLVLIILTGINDHLELTRVPKGMRGIPILLITLGLLSLAFMGLTGIIK